MIFFFFGIQVHEEDDRISRTNEANCGSSMASGNSDHSVDGIPVMSTNVDCDYSSVQSESSTDTCGSLLSEESSAMIDSPSPKMSLEICSGVVSVPMDRSDSTVGQSVSLISTHESFDWDHTGARPKDRPPTQLVPVEQSGPNAAGIDNSFLGRHSQDRVLNTESLHQESEEANTAENLLFVAARNSGLPSPYLTASVNEADNGLLSEEESTEVRQFALGNASNNADNQLTANIGAVLVEPHVLASCGHLCTLVTQLLESIERQGEREGRDTETTERQAASGQQANPVEVVCQAFELPLPCTNQSIDSNHNSIPEVLQAVTRINGVINGARARQCCTCASRGVCYCSLLIYFDC